MTNLILRRSFLTLLGGAAAAWPLTARAQQPERMRRIGVLVNQAATDPEYQTRNAVFLQALQEFGWTVGRNVRIDYRWGPYDADRVRQYVAELLALAPDVILANGATAVAPLLRASRSVPVVFTNVTDPVGAGYVESLARPGGNATGFAQYEYGMAPKFLELLKQIAPRLTRVAVLRDPNISAGLGQFGAIQAVARSFDVELRPIEQRDASETERAIVAFAREPNGGLIVLTGGSAVSYRDLIIALAARHRLPAIYPYRFFVVEGGLMCYGPDPTDAWRRASSYIDRILKGEKAADLPVQLPTKYETVLNMKTAKALGIAVPDIVLLRADEVIE